MPTYEITASFNGTINTGEYANEKPLFSIKEVFDSEKPLNGELAIRQSELFQMVRNQFKKAELQSITEKIQREREDIRIYQIGDNLYPSVTSIIGWDTDFYLDKFRLAQYAARGSIIHKQIELYLKNGEWKDPKDIPECYPDLVTLKKGDLKLSYDDCDFRSFYEKYPFDVIELERTIVNHEHRYAGRLDIKGIPRGAEWKKAGAKEVPTIFDVKTGVVDESKHFTQLSAYWNGEGNEDVEQAAVLIINNKTQQGFSKPKICTDKEKYWSLFLQDRKNFNNRFQI